jgi:predicted glycoside hydrolase/deacetylase ChbG (UPF0249 family)
MNIILNADDFGYSQNITDIIIDCFVNGALTSFSVMANGKSLDYGIKRVQELPVVPDSIGIHLNLVEGYPVGESEKTDLIITSSGIFKYTFVGLWILPLKKKKIFKELKKQVEYELEKQIVRVKEKLQFITDFRLDSHMHIHAIPWIFDIIINLAKRYDINKIRIPVDDYLFIVKKNYLKINPVNYLKFTLLRYLSRNSASRLQAQGFQIPSFFSGVLFSGNMKREVVFEMIHYIKKENEGYGEILFHPGMLSSSELIEYEDYRFLGFQTNKRREREEKELLNMELKKRINEFNNKNF